MESVIPILNALNGIERDILFFLIAMGVIAFAAFCIYVIHRNLEQKK